RPLVPGPLTYKVVSLLFMDGLCFSRSVSSCSDWLDGSLAAIRLQHSDCSGPAARTGVPSAWTRLRSNTLRLLGPVLPRAAPAPLTQAVPRLARARTGFALAARTQLGPVEQPDLVRVLGAAGRGLVPDVLLLAQRREHP